MTEEGAAGKIDDFKVAEDRGVRVASARLRASGCVQNLVLDTDEVPAVTMSWLRLQFSTTVPSESHIRMIRVVNKLMARTMNPRPPS